MKLKVLEHLKPSPGIDYALLDGTYLYSKDWNEEHQVYVVIENNTMTVYFPSPCIREVELEDETVLSTEMYFKKSKTITIEED